MYTILLKQETPTNANATGTFASFWHVCETLIEALSCSLWDCFWGVKAPTATNATNETRQHGIAWNQTSLGLTNKHFQPKPDPSINKTPRWTSANQPQNSQSIRKALQKKNAKPAPLERFPHETQWCVHYDFNFFGLTLPLQKLAFVPRFSSYVSKVEVETALRTFGIPKVAEICFFFLPTYSSPYRHYCKSINVLGLHNICLIHFNSDLRCSQPRVSLACQDAIVQALTESEEASVLGETVVEKVRTFRRNIAYVELLILLIELVHGSKVTSVKSALDKRNMDLVKSNHNRCWKPFCCCNGAIPNQWFLPFRSSPSIGPF